MSRLALHPPQFQHVVFPGDSEPHGDALNLTPCRQKPKRISECPTILPQQDEAFLSDVMARAGLDLQLYKPDTLARRLSACLRTLGTTCSVTARRYLEVSAAFRANDTLDALVIGVTSFFRDAPAFSRLRNQVLPELLAERSGTLRIWSAGCSDGQELYSVALLLSEMNCLLRSQLIGTDCRPNAIRRAIAGRFSLEELHTLPIALRERYFVPETSATGSGLGWRTLDVLRRTVQFRLGDLTRQAEVGPFDLILCRNVSIYLQPDASVALWRRLQAALRPGGILMVGKAEFPAGASALSQVAPGFFRRTRNG
jgi:chemotaxis protein methyltransferase CheR